MTYRARITLSLVSLAAIATIVTGVLVGVSASRRLTDELAANLQGVVATASLRVDGDLFTRINGSGHPYARLLQSDLRQIAAANPQISNLYTGRADGDDLRYVVDGYSRDEALAAYGEAYPLEPQMRTALEGTASTNAALVTDQYGTWISGYAPIRDGAGKVVGLIGADYSAETVRAAWRSFALRTGLILLVVLLASVLLALLLARMLTRPMEQLLAGFWRLEDGDPSTTVDIPSPPEFHRLAEAFNRAEKSVQERDTIKGIFGTFLEKHVAEKVLADIKPGGIPGEMRRITVLFSDIRGYTHWSEDKHPLDLLTALNSYFSEMIDAVLEEQGTIDKFIGDALMVLFGAPGQISDHADQALSAAVRMQRAMRRTKHPFAMGIGINTADVVLGTVGSPKRMSYTAMGDGVNLAQRLESRALPGQILISESTYEALEKPERFDIAKIPAVTVKGKALPIEVYEVRGFAKRGAVGRAVAAAKRAVRTTTKKPATKPRTTAKRRR